MHIDSSPGAHELRIDGRQYELPGPLEQAFAWPGRPLVVVLLAPAAGPKRLLLLGTDGRLRVRVAAPAGYGFYYLEPLADGVSVVCCTDVAVDGWHDWRFAISPGSGELERIGPSK